MLSIILLEIPIELFFSMFLPMCAVMGLAVVCLCKIIPIQNPPNHIFPSNQHLDIVGYLINGGPDCHCKIEFFDLL